MTDNTTDNNIDLDLEFAEPASVVFVVPGIPAPGGSKSAFAIKKGGVYTGRTVVFDAAGQKNKDWRASVAMVGSQAMAGRDPFRGPLMVHFDFVMPRPKSHFRTGKKFAETLRDDAPGYHTNKPDRTKITRSTEDALTGIAWADDTQIVAGNTTKRYGSTPGVRIEIIPL
jgi:Holliday junction resolvase RusA-like endonuclease